MNYLLFDLIKYTNKIYLNSSFDNLHSTFRSTFKTMNYIGIEVIYRPDKNVKELRIRYKTQPLLYIVCNGEESKMQVFEVESLRFNSSNLDNDDINSFTLSNGRFNELEKFIPPFLIENLESIISYVREFEYEEIL